MFLRLILILNLGAMSIMAWDSNLPFSDGVAIHTGHGATANPAGAAIASAQTTELSWTEWNAGTGAGVGPGLWTVQNQGRGHAQAFRFWNGNGPYLARLDLAFAWDAFGVFSPGLRPGYVWDGKGTDHPLLDAGLDFRPVSRAMAGYWIENLYTGAGEPRSHHFAAGVRPFGTRAGASGDFLFGYGMSKAGDSRREDYAFAQMPLGFGIRAETRWNWRAREGSLGVSLQATGQWSAALGWAEGGAAGVQGMTRRLADGVGTKPHRGGAVRFRQDQKTPFLLSGGGVAEIDLNHSIAEDASPPGLLGAGGKLGIMEVMKRFDVVEANPAIGSVVIRLGRARAGWAMGEEIRGRILRLRASGKRVIAYMDQVTPLNYFLASAAEVVAVQPQGYFGVNGFAAELTFYRGLFDKLGVEPQFLRHGKFKSFEEPYTRKEMSGPARADLASFLGSLWDHYLESVSAARNLSKDSLRSALESGEISLAHALKAGLIDTLIHQDQALDLAGGRGASWYRGNPSEVARVAWDVRPQIEVIVVEGSMVLGESARGWLGGPDLAGAETVARQLRRARKNPAVKAVVLRVDSPGGSAQAADIMWREVELLRKAKKPVVASLGHNAASGGYYIACGADRILAAPNSAVGSIGVLWGKFVLRGLYEKLGLNTETVKTSPHADANSMARAWDSSEVEVLQRHMDDFYADFLAKVADGRGKTLEEADSVAQGRIFTGSQALDNGLVDRMGGLQDAIDEAAKLAGLGGSLDAEIIIQSAPGQATLFSLAGRDWARSHAGLEALRGELARIEALSGPGLWAISPELAGWWGDSGPARE